MEESFLLKRKCEDKQLRSHCVRKQELKKEELPQSNPEWMFIRELDREKKMKLIGEVRNLYKRKPIRAIADELRIKRKDVQRILKNHILCQSS